MTPRAAFLPRRAAIDAYGNGGFRFAEMSHKGSLLCLPSGTYGWDCGNPDAWTPDDFAAIFAERDEIGFLLLGTGQSQIFPSPVIRAAFRDVGIGLEPMNTGAACRTFNVMLAEGRPVAAALVAVD